MRDLKVRVWDEKNELMSHAFDVKECWGDYLVDFGDYDADAGSKEMKWLVFTGLKDKNGREIYEGDILSDGFHEYPVQWNNEKAGWMVPMSMGGQFPAEDYEVIGNIYENPELVK